MSDAKRELRIELTRRLRAAGDLDAASASVVKRVRALPEYEAALWVMLYVPFREELDVSPLFGDVRRNCVPRVNDDGQTMVAVFPAAPPPPPDAPAAELIGWRRSTAFGMLEPLGPSVDPGMIDLALVPGLGFTRRGSRLGRGKGHFDRFLPRLRADCFKVGVCHNVQLLDDLPTEPHDVPMDAVVTPSGVYRRTSTGG